MLPILMVVAVLLAGAVGAWLGWNWREKDVARLEDDYHRLHDELVRVARHGSDWHKIHVSKTGRGPNADDCYNGVMVGSKGYLFTFEDCRDARARSQEYWR